MPIDVVVVGAGPAGLYAARLLASKGLGVEVLEEHEVVGDPVHCTGILGTETFTLPGIPREGLLGTPRVARFHSPGGHSVSYTGPEGEVSIIDRGVFDRSLAEAAVRAGARLTTQARAVGVQVANHSAEVQVRIHGRSRTISARVCILACGARYRFQRRLGWGMPPLFLSSAQTEVASAAVDRIEIFFRRDTAPAGFGWLVPISRGDGLRAKVGAMVSTRSRCVLDRLLNDLTTEGLVSGPPGPVVARLLPLAPLARTYGHRVLAIGDAAGLVKPTTGGGIYYSLLSAQWGTEIVRAAFERGDFTPATLGGYEETWRRHLGSELRAGVWLRRLATRLGPADIDALTQLAAADGIMPVIRASARFNWHKDLILRAVRHPGVFRILFRYGWPSRAA